MKIATWNVNSITVRLPHVLKWLADNKPEILCLQELKCMDEKFPFDAFKDIGYSCEVYGQKTYNGVAIISNLPVNNVERGMPGDPDEAQHRIISATAGSMNIINVYIPNGQDLDTPKYHYKLEWMNNLRKYLDSQFDKQKNVVICGDFNIAPADADVYDPILWYGRIHTSDPERKALKHLQDWGFTDVFRKHHPEPGNYSWWDYRSGGYRQNKGLRIDLVWASKSAADSCTDSWIDKIQRSLDKPSDHAPVIAEFNV